MACQHAFLQAPTTVHVLTAFSVMSLFLDAIKKTNELRSQKLQKEKEIPGWSLQSSKHYSSCNITLVFLN
jgi:hypothetical protein